MSSTEVAHDLTVQSRQGISFIYHGSLKVIACSLQHNYPATLLHADSLCWWFICSFLAYFIHFIQYNHVERGSIIEGRGLCIIWCHEDWDDLPELVIGWVCVCFPVPSSSNEMLCVGWFLYCLLTCIVHYDLWTVFF